MQRREWIAVLGLLGCVACDSTADTNAKATVSAADCPGQGVVLVKPLGTVEAGVAVTVSLRACQAKGAAVTARKPVPTPGPLSGSVAKATDVAADGTFSLDWTPGFAPIRQTVLATGLIDGVAKPTELFGAMVTRKGPASPAWFGKVDAYMTAHNLAGSTEDVAIAPGGKFAVMGVAGHLLKVDPAGDVTEWAVQGKTAADELVLPLGLWYDAAGTLWTADSKGKDIKKISPDGQVESVLAEVDGKPLQQPNDLLVAADGAVWFTDPCRGLVVRLDPATKQAKIMASFDAKTQGGPNGIAIHPSDGSVWVTTENTALTCAAGGIPITAKLGSLWRAPANPSGTLTFSAVMEGQGHFGDGCTFDGAGNLYATFDVFNTAGGIKLEASQVWVVPNGETKAGLAVQTNEALFANVVFGKDGFGDGQMLLALLTVPPFTKAEARGLMIVKDGM